MNRGRSAALCGRLIPLFDARLADASGSAASRFWSICFMRFRMRCNLKTAPNIREVSFVSAIGPLLEWNVPVFPMASRRSRAPQTGACLEGGTEWHRPPSKYAWPPLVPPQQRRLIRVYIYGAGAVQVHLKSHALPLMSYTNRQRSAVEVEHTYSLSDSLPISSCIRCHWIRVLSISQCSTPLDAVNCTAQTGEALFRRLQTTSLFIVSIKL